MPYKYKEPETWDELFDALESIPSCMSICPEFRDAINRLQPRNLSSLRRFHSRKCIDLKLWTHILIWWNMSIPGLMSYRLYDLRINRAPTARDIAALRKFLRSKLKEAHCVHG